jgi:hypothetical protein
MQNRLALHLCPNQLTTCNLTPHFGLAKSISPNLQSFSAFSQKSLLGWFKEGRSKNRRFF